ncbi:alpha/beta hydrolase [Longispora fulva]|uniref:Pimeloyl-ACP methyl ester carboxylesterase n=1 Tax=Longispora fulva TaxID=619741 RepID=A0A8J7KR86_9ACTN|nr:alpha/beta hydrolase [Longispora fulva]MBG6138297.1 pimeloyl-ACP methyl ester carboxylesterase [Longispora fulva]GIG60548.1 alpha/beta hydrolase [Longispora fulva]
MAELFRDIAVAAEVPIVVRDHGGEGPDVVLLHGGGRTLEDWRWVVPHLQNAGRRVVAMDLRGHGHSGRAPWTWDGAVADLEAVVDQLGLDRPTVIGHSLGGMLATLWAVRHPECPLAVNVEGFGAPRGPEDFDLPADEAKAACTVVSGFLAGLAADGDPAFARLLGAIGEFDLWGTLRAVRGPVLVVAGERCEHLPEPLAAAMTARRQTIFRVLAALAPELPHLETAFLPTGHDVHLEEPARLVRTILAARA